MDPVRYYFNITTAAYQELTPTLEEIVQDPGIYYDTGDIAWMLTSTMLVFLMIAGISLFYAGISEPKISLAMAWLPLMATAVISLQWFAWGYTIAFSNWPKSSSFWGGTSGLAFHDTLLRPVPATRNNEREGPYVPEILYALFEMMFAAFTAALISVTTSHKERPGHFLLFLLLWSTLVYDPIARWTWNPEGWPTTTAWHALDWAGGNPVHICAAFTVLAHCIFHLHVLPGMEARMGVNGGNNSAIKSDVAPVKSKEENLTLPPIPPAGGGGGGGGGLPVIIVPPGGSRADTPILTSEEYRAGPGEGVVTNYVLVLLGTMLLWVGWFGFNGGSAMGSSVRAVTAVMSTHLAACTGAVSHAVLSALISRPRQAVRGNVSGNGGRKPFVFSLVDFCNGAIIGLVAVTPAAGYIPVWIAPVFGLVPVLLCVYLYWVSELIEDDQSIFVIHGVGGLVGIVLTGVFGRGDMARLDGYSNPQDARGAWDGYPMQILIQLSDAAATAGYTFVVTMAILIIMEPFAFWFRKRDARNTFGQGGENRRIDTAQVLEEEPDFVMGGDGKGI